MRNILIFALWRILSLHIHVEYKLSTQVTPINPDNIHYTHQKHEYEYKWNNITLWDFKSNLYTAYWVTLLIKKCFYSHIHLYSSWWIFTSTLIPQSSSGSTMSSHRLPTTPIPISLDCTVHRWFAWHLDRTTHHDIYQREINTIQPQQ